MDKNTPCALGISIILACVPVGVVAAPISGQGSWETTLQGRDLDGNTATFEAYYDTVLGITWLADAKFAETSGYALNGMNWSQANAWASGLNIHGVTGWRLPQTHPIDGTTADDTNYAYNGTEDYGYNVSAPGTLYGGSTASELAHMFYNTLGNNAFCDPAYSTETYCGGATTYGLENSGPFTHLTKDGGNSYWSETEYAPDTTDAWYFFVFNGAQAPLGKGGLIQAWAVHDGDVAALSSVPLPAAIWLFGTGLIGLIGLIGVARKYKAGSLNQSQLC